MRRNWVCRKRSRRTSVCSEMRVRATHACMLLLQPSATAFTDVLSDKRSEARCVFSRRHDAGSARMPRRVVTADEL